MPTQTRTVDPAWKCISSTIVSFSFMLEDMDRVRVYEIRAATFCTVAHNIFRSSLWNFLHVTPLAPEILRPETC